MMLVFDEWCEKKGFVLKDTPSDFVMPKDITLISHADVMNLMAKAVAWQEFVGSYFAAFKARLLYCNYEKRKAVEDKHAWDKEVVNTKIDLEKCKHLTITYESYIKLLSREITRRTNLAQQELRYDKLTG